MNYLIIALVILTSTVAIGSNLPINSALALPDVKIVRPSICELHPRVCALVPLPRLPDNENFTIPVDWHWNPILQALQCNGLTQCDHSVILMPFDGTVLAITVPTKDIQLTSNTSNPNQ